MLALACACGWLCVTAVHSAIIDLSPERKEPVSDYNLRMGNLRLAFTGTFELGYNDNITRAPSKGGTIYSGWYAQPGLHTSVNWPISTYLAINSGLGLAYRYYPLYSEFTDFIVSSDTGVLSARADASLKLGQTGSLVLSEEFSRTIDSLEIAASTNQGGVAGSSYARNTNELALQYDGDLSEYDHATLRYAHTSVWVQPSEFQYEDHQSDLLDAVLLHTLNRSFRLGPYFTTEYTYYSKPSLATNRMRNDNLALRLGAAVLMTRGAGFTTDARIGWEQVQFDSTNPVPTATSANGLTASVNVNFMTSEFMRHTLFFTLAARQTSLTEDINYGDDLQCGYFLMYHMTKEVYVRADLAYLNRQDSESGGTTDLVRAGIGPGWKLGRNAAIDIHYQYTRLWSDQEQSDYRQNLFTITFTYHF